VISNRELARQVRRIARSPDAPYKNAMITPLTARFYNKSESTDNALGSVAACMSRLP